MIPNQLGQYRSRYFHNEKLDNTLIWNNSLLLAISKIYFPHYSFIVTIELRWSLHSNSEFYVFSVWVEKHKWKVIQNKLRLYTSVSLIPIVHESNQVLYVLNFSNIVYVLLDLTLFLHSDNIYSLVIQDLIGVLS